MARRAVRVRSLVREPEVRIPLAKAFAQKISELNDPDHHDIFAPGARIVEVRGPRKRRAKKP
jgi:hypothetical protein